MRHIFLLLSLLAAAACNGVTTLPSPRAPLPAVYDEFRRGGS